MKTVSRIINNEAHVAAKTAEKVRNAIRELGYVPNVSARRLARNQSHVLALVYHAFDLSGWAGELFSGAVNGAGVHGYEVIAHPYDPRQETSRERLLQLINQRSADGLMLVLPQGGLGEITQLLLDNAVLFVSIQPTELSVPGPIVSMSGRQGAAEITQHLLTLGHKRIGFVGNSQANNYDNQERFTGYRDALAGHGISLDPTLVTYGNFSFQSGVVAGRQLLCLSQPPTAIFAANDDMAAGVIQAAYRMGRNVPGDLSVAGFDDVPLARRTAPPLTTVRQPIAQLAQYATERLIGLVEGQAVEENAPGMDWDQAATLVIRESTAPPQV
jgi:LacI family transcriptional regulator